MREIPAVRKIRVLRSLLVTWQNTHYAATMNYRIGEDIGDTQMMESAKIGVGNALRAIDLLDEEIAGLSRQSNDEPNGD